MFAVPGWNVSAKLATQVETEKPADPAKQGTKSKKRKRAQQERAEAARVDEGNVDQLWQNVVEGKGNGTSTEQGHGSQKDTTHGIQHQTDTAGEKPAKKRKRKGNKGDKKDVNGTDKDAEDAAAAQVATPDTAKAPSTTTTESSKPDKKKRKKDNKSATTAPQTASIPPSLPTTALLPEPSNLTPLQKSMRAKLTSARFRHLNESLYTKPSKESLSLFSANPEMFLDYHRGFAQQVEVWPENPVDGYVSTIISRGKIRVKDPWKDKKRKDKKGGKGGGGGADSEPDSTPTTTSGLKPLPRNMRSHSTIADLGCGVASLSHRLQPSLKTLNLTIHSFDLSKPTGPTADLVTIADISALPLPDSSVDVAVFCLALMGTNWLDFIDEAWRVLRWRGELWVSEIKSRFGRVDGRGGGGRKVPINSVGSLRKNAVPRNDKSSKKGKKKGGGDGIGASGEGIQDSSDEAELSHVVDGAADAKSGTDVTAFVDALKKRGFVLDALPERQNDAIDLSNKMFVKLQFVKGAQPVKGKNVQKGSAGGSGSGSASGGGLRMGIKGKKFAVIGREDDDDDNDEGGQDKDARVLKPCLYKIR